jgi:hypothetical protein
MGAPGGLCVRGRFGQATRSRSRCTSAEIFSMVLCMVSSLCALSPGRIHRAVSTDGRNTFLDHLGLCCHHVV